MCNLSAGIYAEGKQDGIQEGIQKGSLERLMDDVKNAMESFHLSMEDAMNGLKVTQEEQAILRTML